MRKKSKVKSQKSKFRSQKPVSCFLSTVFCLLFSVFCLLFLGCNKSYEDKEPSNFILSPLTRITDDKAIDNFCSVSPNNQYLAFSSNRQGNFDIYIKDVEEKAIIQRTFGKEDDLFPQFSPDGKKIVYSSNRFGSFDIFIIDVEKSGQIQQITYDKKRNEIFADFSSDGNKVLFTSQSEKDAPVIMVFDLKTGLFTEITNGFFARFSKDGKNILFNRDQENIVMVDINGRNERLIFYNENFSSLFPSFSPSGERIVYTSCPKGKMKFVYDNINDIKDLKMDIRCVDIRGMNDTRITGEEGCNRFPVWSNDGFVYFSSLRDGNVDIFRVSQPEEIVRSQEEEIRSQEEIKVKRKFPIYKKPEPNTEVVTIRDNVSIWSYPGKTIIANVDKGIKLYVIDSSKKWYIKVLLPDGRTGWISSFFVE